MMKNIFCLYCLMLCVWPVLAGAAEIDDLLNRLDVVIKDRPHCIVEKKKRLQELKLRLYPGLPDEERFRQLGELLEEYRSFNADSSLAFTQERLHLARRMGGREYLDDARMNLAEVMGIAGMYKEALEQMDAVRPDSLPGYLRSYYFHNLRTLYGWMADYVVVPEEEDITFPEEEDARVDYGGYDVPPAFPGYHAACNAAVAVELALALWRKGWDIPDEAILSALAGAENRSSICILSQKPLVILDACRTPQQAAALLRVLQKAQVRDLCAVAGLESGQGAEEFFAALEKGLLPDGAPQDRAGMPGMGEAGPIDRLFVTVPPGGDPALARELADTARFHFEAEVCPSLPEALAAARAAGGRGLLICGSEALALEAARLLGEG